MPVPPLTRWGVSPDGDLVFRTLTRDGPAVPAQLARSLGLPARRVRVALDELAGAGLARPGLRAWTPVPVPHAVDRLRRRDVERARLRYLTRRHLVSLATLGVEMPERDGVRPLVGAARVRERIAELAATQRYEFLAMHPEPVFDESTVRAAVPASRTLGDRGMSVLSLGVPAGAGDATEDYADDFSAGDVRYRELPTLPLKLMVVDRATALVPIDPDDTGIGGLEITDRSTVDTLVALFLRHWDGAGTWRRGAGSTMELTGRERTIVRLLAQGHTDASASVHLGLSVRTIAYTLRGLMDRYGVQNRFQLGLLLGAGGIEPPTEDGGQG